LLRLGLKLDPPNVNLPSIRITGMSHWCLATPSPILFNFNSNSHTWLVAPTGPGCQSCWSHHGLHRERRKAFPFPIPHLLGISSAPLCNRSQDRSARQGMEHCKAPMPAYIWLFVWLPWMTYFRKRSMAKKV
jgi:hypothetical protein